MALYVGILVAIITVMGVNRYERCTAFKKTGAEVKLLDYGNLLRFCLPFVQPVSDYQGWYYRS